MQMLISWQPIFKEAAEKFSGSSGKIAAPPKKRARAASQSNLEGEEEYSPKLNGHSTPGTNSPNGSSTQSPTRRLWVTPTSPMERGKILNSKPFSNFGFTGRASSYESFQCTDFRTQTPETPAQQPESVPYLPDGGLSEQNSIYASQDLFNFVPHNMGPVIQQQYIKDGPASQLNSPIYPPVSANDSSFNALEGNPLGPVPPYLLQNQQSMIEDIGMGSGNQMQGQQMDSGNIDQPMPNQFFMTNSGGDGSVPNFWRDEWGEILLPPSYRNA
jgi:hypothetical protein